MECAVAGFFQPYWSYRIHDEWTGNLLVNRPDLSPERLARTRQLMNAAIPRALVTGYEPLIETLTLPDSNDRHVLAAAIHSKASVIVTFNLRDFPKAALAPYNLIAQSPDDFLFDACTPFENDFLTMVRRHRSRLTNPPKSLEAYLATLSQNHMHRVVDYLSDHIEDL